MSFGVLLGASSPETCCHSLQRMMAQAWASGLLSFLTLDFTNAGGLGFSSCRRGGRSFLYQDPSGYSPWKGEGAWGRVHEPCVFSKLRPRGSRQRCYGRRQKRPLWVWGPPCRFWSPLNKSQPRQLWTSHIPLCVQMTFFFNSVGAIITTTFIAQILTITLMDYYAYFTDGKTKAQRGKIMWLCL